MESNIFWNIILKVHIFCRYSEKATKFFEIFTLLLSVCTVDKSMVEILQNFVAFSEYMNFTHNIWTINIVPGF